MLNVNDRQSVSIRLKVNRAAWLYMRLLAAADERSLTTFMSKDIEKRYESALNAGEVLAVQAKTNSEVRQVADVSAPSVIPAQSFGPDDCSALFGPENE